MPFQVAENDRDPIAVGEPVDLAVEYVLEPVTGAVGLCERTSAVLRRLSFEPEPAR
jgi:hypothetical protein